LTVLTRALLAVAVAAFGYFGIYRPLQLRWGATAEEVGRPMPGDAIQPKAIFDATRAITIAASPEKIWPWLIQIGYRRAGWYGYDWVDNDGIPSSDKIEPELQSLKVGDTLPIWRQLNFPVLAVAQNHYVVFASTDRRESMTLALYPAANGDTRLVWRIRLGKYQWTSKFIFGQLLTELADFIAVRQALDGIKARAEGSYRHTKAPYVELFAWFMMFLAFVVALVMSVVRKECVGFLLLAILIGSNTVVCVLVRPHLFADLLGVLAVAVAMVALYRGRQRPAPNSMHAPA
jgi:hypothetical protein